MQQHTLVKTILAIGLVFLALFSNINAQTQNSEQILASAGSSVLKGSDVNVYVKVIQFVVGEKIKPNEVIEIQNEAIRDFNQAPKKFLAEAKEVGQMMNQIYKFTDPIKIAEGRLMFLGEFYKAGLNTPENDWSSVLKIQKRYVKVLQYNPQNGLLLTNKDVEAFLNFVDFMQKLSSGSPVTATARSEFQESLIENYFELSTEQQALFVVMPIIWQVVDGQWKKLSPQQHKEVIAQFKAQNNQSESQTGQVANSVTAPKRQAATPRSASSGNKVNLTAQQKLLRKRLMYQMMSNMSRSRHLSTMNIIENIGGTGNYWTLSPSY